MATDFIVLPNGWWDKVKAAADSPAAKVYIVSPYLTSGPLKEILTILKGKGDRLRILTCYSREDIQNGATSIRALRFCDEHGIEKRALPDLHAKAYVITNSHGRHTVFVGSGNLTDRGTGLNREMMVRVREPEKAAAIVRDVEQWWDSAGKTIESRRLNDVAHLEVLASERKLMENLGQAVKGLIIVSINCRRGERTYRFSPKELVPAQKDLAVWERLSKTGFALLTGKDIEQLRHRVDAVSKRLAELTVQTPWGPCMYAEDVPAFQRQVEKETAAIERAWKRLVGNTAGDRLERRLRRTVGKEMVPLFQEGKRYWRKELARFWKGVRIEIEKMVSEPTPPLGVSCAFQILSPHPIYTRPDDLQRLQEARETLWRRKNNAALKAQNTPIRHQGVEIEG